MVKNPVRNTIQRKIVLDTVFELKNHPTADEVYASVFSMHPTISRGTVYRNLNMLANSGQILKIEVPDSADRFDHNTHRHYHVKCRNCNEFIDIELPNMTDIHNKIENMTQYDIEDLALVFKGLCPKCKQRSN